MVSHARCYSPSYACKSSIADGPGVSPICAPTSTPVSQEEQLPLYGKTAFITGAGTGIGLAIAKRFLKEGAGRVVIVGRDRMRLLSALRDLDEVMRTMKVEGKSVGPVDDFAKLEEAAEVAGPIDPLDHRAATIQPNTAGSRPSRLPGEPEILHYRHVSLVVGDVSSWEFYGSELINLLDATDILVNSAGVSRSSVLPLASAEGIHEMTNSNLIGTILPCRYYIRRLLRKKASDTKNQKAGPPEAVDVPNHGKGAFQRGVVAADDGQERSILNISSLQATNPTTGALVYAATKAGVISFTRGIVNEISNMKNPIRLRANVLNWGRTYTMLLVNISPLAE
ncbi:hypothetical protein KEM54_000114 [Ascosphaera aggregata]|nr:hypothetical protein KEM54_000114 [Ascosphaera aggregata]